MNHLIDRLSQDQLQAVILALIAGVVAIVGIVALTKYQLQSLTDDTALKREQQEAALSIRKKAIEHAVATGTNLDALLTTEMNAPTIVTNPEELDGKLAKGFGMLEIPAGEIEDILARALTLDSSRKKAIVEMMKELIDEGTSHESILAAARALCTSAKTRAPETERALDEVSV